MSYFPLIELACHLFGEGRFEVMPVVSNSYYWSWNLALNSVPSLAPPFIHSSSNKCTSALVDSNSTIPHSLSVSLPRPPHFPLSLPISLWSEAPEEGNWWHKAVVSGMMRIPGKRKPVTGKDEGGNKRVHL